MASDQVGKVGMGGVGMGSRGLGCGFKTCWQQTEINLQGNGLWDAQHAGVETDMLHGVDCLLVVGLKTTHPGSFNLSFLTCKMGQ